MVGMLKFECFFRESAGPGWALVGDAGHFKDPAPGQGIGDAFRQAEAMAPVIVGSINDSDAALDAALRDWARWRDRDAAEHYWLATDFGAARPTPSVVVEVTRRLYAAGSHRRAGECVPASQQAVGGVDASGRCSRPRPQRCARRVPTVRRSCARSES